MDKEGVEAVNVNIVESIVVSSELVKAYVIVEHVPLERVKAGIV
jgi:hypothetical protein